MLVREGGEPVDEVLDLLELAGVGKVAGADEHIAGRNGSLWDVAVARVGVANADEAQVLRAGGVVRFCQRVWGTTLDRLRLLYAPPDGVRVGGPARLACGSEPPTADSRSRRSSEPRSLGSSELNLACYLEANARRNALSIWKGNALSIS